MNTEVDSRIVIDLADAKEKAQTVYHALHRTRFESFCNTVFFFTQFTQEPREYSLNGSDIVGYEIRGRNLAGVVKHNLLNLLSLLTGNQYEENWNYKLKFPIGGRVEVEILETLCKSKKCNRNFTGAILKAQGIDYFNLAMMDYAK